MTNSIYNSIFNDLRQFVFAEHQAHLLYRTSRSKQGALSPALQNVLDRLPDCRFKPSHVTEFIAGCLRPMAAEESPHRYIQLCQDVLHPPSIARTVLQTSYGAINVLSFLSASKPSDLPKVKTICKAWNRHANHALRLQLESRTELDIETLARCNILGVNIKTLSCMQLRTLNLIENDRSMKIEPPGSITYLQFPSNSFFPFLRNTPHLNHVVLDRPSWTYLRDILPNCPRLTALSFHMKPYEIPASPLLPSSTDLQNFLTNAAPVFSQIHHMTWEQADGSAPLTFTFPFLIGQMPALKTLRIDHSQLTPDDIEAIGRSSITRLELVHARFLNGLLAPHFNKLSHLRIEEIYRAGDDVDQEFEDLDDDELYYLSLWHDRLVHCTQLISLEIGGDNEFSDDILKELTTSCKQLTHLDLKLLKDGGHDMLTFDGYRALLTGSTSLTSLDLTGRAITQEDLASLRKTYPAVKITG